MEVSGWREAWYPTALGGAIQLFIIFPSGTPCELHSLEELAFCASYQSSTLQARKKSILKSLLTDRTPFSTTNTTFAFDGVVTAAAEARIPA